MSRPTLDDIFAENDEYGLLEVNLRSGHSSSTSDHGVGTLKQVGAFFESHGRIPDPDADDLDEMRLGSIWEAIKKDPTPEMLEADHYDLLKNAVTTNSKSWRELPDEVDVPASLDDIFDDDDLDIDMSLIDLKHSTPASERHLPDHRAEFVPCPDFEQFRERFETVQQEMDDGTRQVLPVKKWAIIEPLEGDFFIRNGLLAMIAEKSEMTQRGGAREHRLRVIFSNGMESDPLMSSFRKSLNDDKTARTIQKRGLGPLDPEWENDQLELSGTIYVARSLSEDPAIKEQRMILHKIGVTSQDVRRRVADAKNDPTFLLAPVEIVATYELRNLSRRKVENLLHRFFAPAQPSQLFVLDRFGKKVSPKEWFYVLPEHIGQAVKLIQDGTLHLYQYDASTQKISIKT
ncbi:GIY-YIG nuclease family protein [Cohaesibacter haloalkalitolerans]|uniref:GIY-YIG nuclease family protein n=1 Tax=Cohaesibacter haloalkalitolerans TaxID=1162980 RepID=UPI000E65863F|nr:GIY-YIG nuclease family protein [Cohaesibacter haloalkalitolerans]